MKCVCCSSKGGGNSSGLQCSLTWSLQSWQYDIEIVPEEEMPPSLLSYQNLWRRNKHEQTYTDITSCTSLLRDEQAFIEPNVSLTYSFGNSAIKHGCFGYLQ